MIRLISEEISEILSTTISQITCAYSKSEHIDSIYMKVYLAPSIDILNRKSVVEITLVYSDSAYKEMLCDLGRTLKRIEEKFGYEIRVIGAPSSNYCFPMGHMRELRACRELYNGRILYDRTGKYKKLKDFLSKSENRPLGIFSYENGLEFIPPLQLKKIESKKR